MVRPRLKVLAALWLAFTVGLGCGKSHKPVIFVAASLADVGAAWQAKSYVAFDYHSGASYLLANQILAGARADLFLAAGPDVITGLEKTGLVARVDSSYLRNHLVLVCARNVEPPAQLEDLVSPRFARIAVADPELAPAGGYARAGLQRLGLWDELKPRMIFTGDVRMAAETVRLATADAAFVYATDVPAGRTALALDSALFPAANYPLVLLAPSTPTKDSLWAYLHSQPAREAARARGFR